MAAQENKAQRGGASLSRTALGDRFQAWLQHHRLSAADSLLRVLQSPVASLLTFLVIGIALALPVGLNVALQNFDQLSKGWDSPAQMSAFLHDAIAEDDAQALGKTIEQRSDIDTVTLVSKDSALVEFASLSGFEDILSSLEENPLPHVLLVTPDEALTADQLSNLREELESTADVSEVTLDMAWLQRLQAILELGRRFIYAVGGMLVLGVILILGNTIRLTIENRREEIVIVKLVGGSNAFVRRPFLYTGLWYGVGGGLLSGLLVAGAFWFLQEPIADLGSFYESEFRAQGLGVMGVLNLIIMGGFLGLLGAWLAVSRHLAQIEPR
jgi:cell division transport system permease protein